MKRRSFRSPFVVTVLAASACGGTAVTSSNGDGGPQPGCPSSEPQAGTACANPGAKCSYPFCGYERVSTCTAGKWDVAAGSCNPPAPVCPDALPQNGTPCTLPGGTICTYPSDPNNCCPPYSATCGPGVWQTSTPTCNPPGLACPTNAPVDGASCASTNPCAIQVYDCGWGDCGDGMTPAINGHCDGKTWTLSYCASTGSEAGAP